MDRNISSPKGDDRFHSGPVYHQFASLPSSSSSSSRVDLFATTECCRSQLHGCSHHEGGMKLRVWKKEDGIRSTTKKREQLYSRSMASDVSSNNNRGSSPNRVCADCSATKTALWRSGPYGPKSLCNACGIRQRKARRAMAGEEIRPLKMQTKEKEKKTKKKKKKKKKMEVKNAAESGSEGRVEEVLRKVRKSLLGIQRVFPEDEKDAAILLMTLSLSSSSSSSSSSIIH